MSSTCKAWKLSINIYIRYVEKWVKSRNARDLINCYYNHSGLLSCMMKYGCSCEWLCLLVKTKCKWLWNFHNPKTYLLILQWRLVVASRCEYCHFRTRYPSGSTQGILLSPSQVIAVHTWPRKHVYEWKQAKNRQYHQCSKVSTVLFNIFHRCLKTDPWAFTFCLQASITLLQCTLTPN